MSNSTDLTKRISTIKSSCEWGQKSK